MRKKEAGQAFILVLILLAIGALLLVPALRLTSASLQNSQIVPQQMKALYAAEGAQEYVLWKLRYQDWGSEFTQDGEEKTFSVDVCDIPVNVKVIMRAVEGEEGTALATEDKIKPTKTVDPSWVPDKNPYTYTYTITLDYISDISEDNPKVYLDAIYDLPPGGFKSDAYVGPTELSLDSGITWQEVPDPEWSHAKGYLKWPADYEWDPVVTGAFSSHPEFYGIEDFEEREVKMLRFKMRGTLDDNDVHCNWVVLKMDDDTNTLSGPQAPIKVGGDPDIPGVCEDDQVLEVSKTSDPEVIPPGVPTDVDYTISITNMYTSTRSIQEITDYLPPEFEYVGLISSELVNPSEECQILELDPLDLDDPNNPDNDISLLNINGVDRLQLRWRIQKFPQGNAISIHSNQTLKLTFRAKATKDVSGSYYNEVIVILKDVGLGPLSSGLEAAGVVAAEFGNNYSWLTGAVTVPAYDSETEAEDATIYANMALIVGGVAITSWQVE